MIPVGISSQPATTHARTHACTHKDVCQDLTAAHHSLFFFFFFRRWGVGKTILPFGMIMRDFEVNEDGDSLVALAMAEHLGMQQ